jgi:hypothetical protein
MIGVTETSHLMTSKRLVSNARGTELAHLLAQSLAIADATGTAQSLGQGLRAAAQ